jgi:DNA-binding NarL/FixJ family response regulator
VSGTVVAIASPNAVVRRGWRALLEEAGMQVAAKTETAALVVWDVDSAGAPEELDMLMSAHPGARIIAVVSPRRHHDPADLLARGVVGIVDSDLDEAALVQAVRSVRDGRTVLNAGPRGDASPGRMPQLTRRELQVLQLLGDGRTNRDIADALVISENTVKNHVRRLYEKLQVRSRTEAVVLGVRWGLINLAVGPTSASTH